MSKGLNRMFAAIFLIAIGFALLAGTPAPEHKTTCPHYVTVLHINSHYDHWAGTIVTITMEDGGTYQSKHHQVTNYVGQKICSTDLDKL